MSDIVRNFFSQANPNNLVGDELMALIREEWKLSAEDLEEVGIDDVWG